MHKYTRILALLVVALGQIVLGLLFFIGFFIFCAMTWMVVSLVTDTGMVKVGSFVLIGFTGLFVWAHNYLDKSAK